MTSLAKQRAYIISICLFWPTNLAHSGFVSCLTLALPTVACLQVLIKLPQLARTHQILSHQSSLSTPTEPRRRHQPGWLAAEMPRELRRRDFIPALEWTDIPIKSLDRSLPWYEAKCLMDGICRKEMELLGLWRFVLIAAERGHTAVMG